MSDVYDIVIADDGELDDVRSIFEELDVEWHEWSKDGSRPTRHSPAKLFVTTVLHALTQCYERSGNRDPQRPVWIAIATNESLTQRQQLLQAGFDYLIRRPVHRGALRLLLQREMFSGAYSRQVERVAVGYGITFRRRLFPRKAVLVDLSPRGCRIFTFAGVQNGSRITVKLPAEIACGKTFSIKGNVVRTRPAQYEGGVVGESSLGIKFVPFALVAKQRMQAILKELASGPVQLSSDSAKAASDDKSRTPAAWPQQRDKRHVYETEVLVFGAEAGASVLVGRNLSRGGMFVDPHPALSVGKSVRIALEPHPNVLPVIVGARVIRDEGDRGLALKFDWIDEGQEQRFDQMLAALPEIETLSPDQMTLSRLVFSELLPRMLRLSGKS